MSDGITLADLDVLIDGMEAIAQWGAEPDYMLIPPIVAEYFRGERRYPFIETPAFRKRRKMQEQAERRIKREKRQRRAHQRKHCRGIA